MAPSIRSRHQGAHERGGKVEKVRAHAREAWRQARQQSKFSLFKPHLDKVLKLTRQMADCWGYQDSPYNALVEGYEPAATAAQLRQLFQSCARP